VIARLCLAAIAVLLVGESAHAQLCTNNRTNIFSIQLRSLIEDYPGELLQSNIQNYVAGLCLRDGDAAGLFDSTCCQTVDIVVLPSLIPASCATISDAVEGNLLSCAQAATQAHGNFSVTVVDAITVCGGPLGTPNASACIVLEAGGAMFLARNNAVFPPEDVVALANDYLRTALIHRTMNPYFIGSAPPGDLFGPGNWNGNMSAPTCVQMHAWSSPTGQDCECAQQCVTSDGTERPHGQACGPAVGNQRQTCNFGICDGPLTNGCSDRGDDTDSDGVCDDGDQNDVEHGGQICGVLGSPSPPGCDDNCWGPTNNGFNPDQANADQDNFGDLCDRCEGVQDSLETPDHYQLDHDIDSWPDQCDSCPNERDASNFDRDDDTWGDVCDNCPAVPNGPDQVNVPGVGDQADEDDDTVGDACDPTSGLPGDTDADGDGMPLRLEQIAGTSDSDSDSDNDGLSDWLEWATYGTDPTDADTDDDGVSDQVEIAQGSDPRDPESALGFCGDLNRDAAVNIIDASFVRRKLAAATVPVSYTANRCDFIVAGACTAADVSELRAYLADPLGSPLADICPGVPHDVTTVLYSMDGQASVFTSTSAQRFDEPLIKVEGAGSLRVVSTSPTADAAINDTIPASDWTGKRLRFWMLVPDTSHFGASDGFRVTLSSHGSSVSNANRIWYFGTNEVPHGVWKEYEIDPTVGWDEANNTINLSEIRRFRIQWNLNEGAGRVGGEQIYLDDFRLFDPAFP